jgi:hypothetical protein
MPEKPFTVERRVRTSNTWKRGRTIYIPVGPTVMLRSTTHYHHFCNGASQYRIYAGVPNVHKRKD